MEVHIAFLLHAFFIGSGLLFDIFNISNWGYRVIFVKKKEEEETIQMLNFARKKEPYLLFLSAFRTFQNM